MRPPTTYQLKSRLQGVYRALFGLIPQRQASTGEQRWLELSEATSTAITMNLLDLAPEIVVHILAYLDFRDVMRAAQVSILLAFS